MDARSARTALYVVELTWLVGVVVKLQNTSQQNTGAELMGHPVHHLCKLTLSGGSFSVESLDPAEVDGVEGVGGVVVVGDEVEIALVRLREAAVEDGAGGHARARLGYVEGGACNSTIYTIH